MLEGKHSTEKINTVIEGKHSTEKVNTVLKGKRSTEWGTGRKDSPLGRHRDGGGHIP